MYRIVTQRVFYRLLLPVGVAALLLPAWGQAYYGTPPRGAVQPAYASGRDTRDPGSIFVSARQHISEAEVLAAKQSYNSAIQKGQAAERLLAILVRDYPNWNPKIVEYRRKVLAERMAAYRKKAGVGGSIIRRPSTGPTIQELPADPTPYDPTDSDFRPVRLPTNYDKNNRELYEGLARAQEEVRRLAEAYTKLNSLYEETQKKLIEERNSHKEYKERYDALQSQITTERTAYDKVIDKQERDLAKAAAKYHDAETALKEEQARAEELQERLRETEARLKEAQESLARVTAERDNLLQENETLRAIVELNSPEKTKALLDQNLTLAEQLKSAQEKIQQLEAMKSGADDENVVLARQLEDARAEAAKLREEMNRIYDENLGYRKRISELSEQLANLETEIASRASTPVVDPALVEENKVLRGIIDKQRRTLDMQEESRRLLFETYRDLKKDDPEVMRILRKMQDNDPQELTAEELKILEDVRNGITQSVSDTVRRNLAVETLAELAGNAFAKGRYASAEQLYLNLFDIVPDNVAGLVNLGTILLYNNKNEEALNYLTRAIRLAPDTTVCHYLTGIAQYRLEQLPEAAKSFARTVQLDPAHAEAFFYLANVETLMNNFEPALKHFAVAVKLKPDLADAHYNMARLYAETRRFTDAARSYDRAIHSGAAPDAEFEQFLRLHPDTKRTPGADLVSTIRPDVEARALTPPAEPKSKTPTGAAAPPAEPAEQAFLAEVKKITTPVPAVQTPSPASVSHEAPESAFSSVQLFTAKGKRIFRLRSAAPHRLRTRGTEDIAPVK